MALLTTRLLRRGLEIFAAISVLGFAGLLLYGNNLERFLEAMISLHWIWLLAAVGLASLDWFGGGLRLFVLCRHVYPAPTLKGAVIASGLSVWGAYLTPMQTGAGPVKIFTLKRYGMPIPEGMVVSVLSLVVSVIFYAIAGPLAIFLGAGRSLSQHGVIGHAIDLYDLFRLALAGFVGVGGFMILLMAFPGLARRLIGALSAWFERRGKTERAERLRKLQPGVDQAHQAVKQFLTPRGWLAMVVGVVLSGAAHANKLLAAWVVLRMLGIHAPFVDVLLLQTFITFVLYFAPTPGGSGLAELLSAAVMSIYVPRELTPSYILLWRLTMSYLTVAVGSVIFWHWLKGTEAKGPIFESG